MKHNLKKVVIVLAASAITLCSVSNVSAQTDWQKAHPRRTQVNDRLNNQNARIHNERKEGEISGAQAKQLHKEDHNIRKEERNMAAEHNGHITKGEQNKINRQENRVSNQIGK
jgi:hypothetical protein